MIAAAALLLLAADPALLLGFNTGARLELEGPTPRFVVGAGPELLTSGGLSLGLRGELAHDLEGRASLSAGWAGPGIVRGDGVPLALVAGPLARWSPAGAPAIGAQLRGAWGLWYARAMLELEASLVAPLAGSPAIAALSLGLRWVPWGAVEL